LAHEGEYGLVTRLSREIGVSRQTLTIWREWGRRMLTRGAASTPEVTTASRERSLLTLLVSGHTSYRGIQICLAELLGWRISLGSIAREVRLAGERADAVLAELAPPGPVVLAVDECFGGLPRQGYLSAVDARSGAVWGVRGPVVPDGAVWQGVLEEVAAHGVRWTGAVHDGGKSAAAGIAAVTPAATRQRDIWHVLHRCAQTQARLERVIRKAEANWESAERYVAAVAMGKRPRYRPPAVPADAQAAAVDALVQTAADLGYLTSTLHDLLAVVVVEHGRLIDVAARRQAVETVLVLLAELAAHAPAAAQPELVALQGALVEAADGLLVFAAMLDPIHRDLTAILGESGIALVGWAWNRRAILGDGDVLIAQLPPRWRAAARVLIAAWTTTVRASSAVEGWHSLLRPHLAVHRGCSRALQALLAVWHNHRAVARGVHRGRSPLHRSGLVTAPTDWLTALGYPPPTPVTAPPHHRQPEVRVAA
jgi:hypothetical protein